MAIITPRRRRRTIAADWLAVERVCREPVSLTNSLLTGKNTGTFNCFAGRYRVQSHQNPYPERFSSPPPFSMSDF
jgi:hypothetical protein